MARPSKEYQAFTHLVDNLLSVPHSVIVERMAEHRRQSDLNPRKRGPKPKSAPRSGDRDPGAS